MKRKLSGLLFILWSLIAISCHQEKRKVIITSEVTHQDGYYQENIETIYIKGIPREVDRGHAVSARWCFDVRDINDTNCLNVHSVHVDEDLWGNKSYHQGDTLEISLGEYQNIFDSRDQDQTESEDGTIIIINNVVITDTIEN